MKVIRVKLKIQKSSVERWFLKLSFIEKQIRFQNIRCKVKDVETSLLKVNSQKYSRIKNKASSGSRCLHGRMVNSPLPRDTQNLNLHMKQFPLSPRPQTSWMTSTYQENKKKRHIKVDRRVWDTYLPYPPPPVWWLVIGRGLTTPKFSLRSQRFTPTSGTPTFQLCAWEMTSQNV